MSAGSNVASQNGQTNSALTRTDIMLSIAKRFPNERDRQRFANILNNHVAALHNIENGFEEESPRPPGPPPNTRNAVQTQDRKNQQRLNMPARPRPIAPAHLNVANERDNGISPPERIVVDTHLVAGTRRQNQTTVPAQPILSNNQRRGIRNDTEKSSQREHRQPVVPSKAVTNDLPKTLNGLPTNEAIQDIPMDMRLEYNNDVVERRDSSSSKDEPCYGTASISSKSSSRSQPLMRRSKAEMDEETCRSTPVIPKRIPVCQFCFLNIHEDHYATCDNRQHVFCRRCITRYVQAFVKSNARTSHPSGLLSCLSGNCVGHGSVFSHEMIHRMCEPTLQEAYQEKIFEVMFMTHEPPMQGTASSIDGRGEQRSKRVVL